MRAAPSHRQDTLPLRSLSPDAAPSSSSPGSTETALDVELAQHAQAPRDEDGLGSAREKLLVVLPGGRVFMTNIREHLPSLDRPTRFLHPRVPPGQAPWAAALPAVHEHYVTTLTDYSGLGMDLKRSLPIAMQALLSTDPVTLTTAVLFGETWQDQGKFQLRPDTIFSLKAFILHTINRAISDAANNPTHLGLVIQVRCIAGYEAAFADDFDVCRSHLRGAKAVVARFRGPNINQYFENSVAALRWQDRVVNLIAGTDDYVWDKPKNAFWNPASPLLLATLPSEADCGGRRHWQRMLTSAHLSPGNELLTKLHETKLAVDALLRMRPRTMPNVHDIHHQLSALETSLLTCEAGNTSSIPLFTEARCSNQRLACECLRLTGLVLIQSGVLECRREIPAKVDGAKKGTDISSGLEHAIQTYFAKISLPQLLSHSPSTAFWSLSIVGPLSSGHVRTASMSIFSLALGRCDIFSLDQARCLLQALFYLDWIHQNPFKRFWDEAAETGPNQPLPLPPERSS